MDMHAKVQANAIMAFTHGVSAQMSAPRTISSRGVHGAA